MKKRRRYFFRPPYSLNRQVDFLNSFSGIMYIDNNRLFNTGLFGLYSYLLCKKISEENIDRLSFTPYKKVL
jgi:hypothetical protein